MYTNYGEQYRNLVQRLKDSKGINENFSMNEIDMMNGFAESIKNHSVDGIEYYRENLISLIKNPGIPRQI